MAVMPTEMHGIDMAKKASAVANYGSVKFSADSPFPSEY
jgi:hypothetical protein